MEPADLVVYTAEEAAKILRMSLWTFRQKCRRNLIPHHRDGGRIKVTQQDLNSYLDSTRVQTEQEGTS